MISVLMSAPSLFVNGCRQTRYIPCLWPTHTNAPPSPFAITRPVEGLIHVISGQKVMLDRDLAALYEVPTKSLNLAVRRNQSRFPDDFMFRLTPEEVDRLRLQFETSKPGRGGRRYSPYAFTEPGVARLSSVLRSERAVQMNIIIVRAFIRLRELVISNKDIAARDQAQDRFFHRQGLSTGCHAAL
jgi:hypothetical protein